MSKVSEKRSPAFRVRLPIPKLLTQLSHAAILDKDSTGNEHAEVLQGLLEKGHVSVAPLREPKLILHSHLPHLLGSAYFLQGNSQQLSDLYEHEITTLVPVDESFIKGGAITRDNWRNFLSQKPYTVAYVEFFDEEIKRSNGDWKEILRSYLFAGPEPLINGYIGGLAHPFIHLAYAWELQSSTVATEALSLGCTEYIELHGLLDQPSLDNSMYKSTSLANVIKMVNEDHRFDNLFDYPGITNIPVLLEKRYDALLEHWNAWEVNDPLAQLEQCCDLSVLLAIGTGDRTRKFDFYLIHTMTAIHAIRVLWHFFPDQHQLSILRQYALFMILVYICQLRPRFEENIIETIESVPLDGWTWDKVVSEAWNNKWFRDSHFFKVVRAPKAFHETFGSKEGFYLKAVAKFLTEFDGWEGFGLGVEGFLPNRDGYIPK